MRVLLFAGSQRRASFNLRLLEHLARGIGPRAEIDLLHPHEVSLPLFNQDLETDAAIVAQVDALHGRFCEADALVFASPEYNALPSPFLKNTLDWISRWPHIRPATPNPFHAKPALLCSASTGASGGVLGLNSLRTLLAYLGANVIGQQICVSYAEHVWLAAGYDFDPLFDDYLASTLNSLLMLANKSPAPETA